jgi:hypothetical protein
MGASSEANDAATVGIIKAAKKTLKRQESGSMKIKHLAKSLLEKFSDTHTKSTVRQVIEKNDMFHVDGKVVMLKRSNSSSKKRKSLDDGAEDVDSSNGSFTKDERKAAKKEAKKAKMEKKSSSSSSSATSGASSSLSSSTPDNSSIQTWRTEHKIVLRDSRNDEEGAAATKLLATNSQFYPYQSFDAPGCVENIVDSLIRQCTVVNGFAKPSPIQAQCWVSTKYQAAS